MKNRTDDLADQLREDADRGRPEFSDELHIRVMAAVRRENLRDQPRRSPVSRPESSRWWWAFLAAPVVVVAVFVIWSAVNHKAVAPVQQIAMPDVPAVGEMVRESIYPLREKLNDARFAYLDRDGKRLAEFLWRSIPVTPRDPNEHRS